MGVIGHQRKGKAIDREDRSQMFQPLPRPQAPMFVIVTGQRIEPAEKGTSDTAIPNMNDLNFSWIDGCFAGLASHERVSLRPSGNHCQADSGKEGINLWYPKFANVAKSATQTETVLFENYLRATKPVKKQFRSRFKINVAFDHFNNRSQSASTQPLAKTAACPRSTLKRGSRFAFSIFVLPTLFFPHYSRKC